MKHIQTFITAIYNSLSRS